MVRLDGVIRMPPNRVQRRADGGWKITKFAIMHDLPFVIPGN